MDIDDTKIKSIVIVTNLRGYTAHLRFTDSSLDEDISAASKVVLHTRIDQKVFRALGIRNTMRSPHYERRMATFR